MGLLQFYLTVFGANTNVIFIVISIKLYVLYLSIHIYIVLMKNNVKVIVTEKMKEK